MFHRSGPRIHLWGTPQNTSALPIVPSGFSYVIFLSERKEPMIYVK